MARKSLLPRKEFIAQGKQRFLAVFDASPLAVPSSAPRGSGLALFFKFSIGVMAAVCLAVGVSVYADTANVPTTSSLYPLKRLSENVQLALAPAADKPQLQATFAVRRVNEIDALQVTAPTSTLIPQLQSDLNTNIDASLDAGDASVSSSGISAAGSLDVYCKTFAVSTSSVFFGSLESNLVLHPGLLAKFNRQCGSDSHASGTENASGIAPEKEEDSWSRYHSPGGTGGGTNGEPASASTGGTAAATAPATAAATIAVTSSHGPLPPVVNIHAHIRL